MKKDIHPKYVETKVTCACGNTFTVKSNKEELHLEVCNKCHPFFTGQNAVARNIKKYYFFYNYYWQVYFAWYIIKLPSELDKEELWKKKKF